MNMKNGNNLLELTEWHGTNYIHWLLFKFAGSGIE